MKRCPKCNQQFTEDWLTFCTSDGTPLTEASPTGDPPPTMTMPRPPVTATQEERPTMRMPPEGAYGGPLAAPQQQQAVAPAWQPPPAPFAMAAQPQQTLAVTSLVFGLVTITLGWCCFYIGVLTGPIAVVLGVVALVQIKNNPTQYTGKPLAITGIAIGALGLLLLVLLIVFGFIGTILGGLK
jgi:hypothetical protein